MRLPILAAALCLPALAAHAQWQRGEQPDAAGRPQRFIATAATAFVTEQGNTIQARAQLRVLADMVVLANGDGHICADPKRPVQVKLQADDGPLLTVSAAAVLPGGRSLQLDRRAEAAVLAARASLVVETLDSCWAKSEMRFDATGLPETIGHARPR
ncbi:hypothetical protein [Siccirubricoccus phaeus]|uniref:hypothetical protein n=1 Tax=Siccirubricoccus phaeus TaxID=2595053 RepID=UPI0011F1A937|nr:hypothetical protein [Siccirubricoccus phaeus]